MRTVVVLLLALAACPPPPKLPPGARACSGPADCPDGFVCGFAGWDQPASCVYSPGDDS